MSDKKDNEQLAYARPDYDRKRRCGWPEVIYGEGKTAEQIVAIFRRLMEKNVADEQGRRSPICHPLLC